MKQNTVTGNGSQEQPDDDRKSSEVERMKLVDWLRKAIDLNQHLFEPELLPSRVAKIIGTDSLDELPTPTNTADQLACLLIEFKKAVSADEEQRRQALEMMERAIEVCFTHSPVFEFALKLYTMEQTSDIYLSAWRAAALSDVDSLYGMLEAVIERSETMEARAVADRESGAPVSDQIRMKQAKLQRLLDSQWLDEKTLDWVIGLMESPSGSRQKSDFPQ